jgi:hypothetical protein
MRFHVLVAANMKTTSSGMLRRSLIKVYRRFGHAYYISYPPDDGGSKHLRNIGQFLPRLHGRTSQEIVVFK